MKIKLIIPAVAGLVILTGCAATEKWAEGIAVKNVSGNGTFMKSVVGIDPDSKIPGVHTTFVSGDLATTKSGTNNVTYREELSTSIWNAKCTTRKRFLAITLTDEGKVEEAIKAVSDVLKSVSGTPAPDQEETPAE